jgi:hypothetical protein
MIESRGECVGNPGHRQDGAGDEAEEAEMFVADAVGEDLSCSFDWGVAWGMARSRMAVTWDGFATSMIVSEERLWRVLRNWGCDGLDGLSELGLEVW